MENQEYVFEEKAENQGDEIIIGDIEFKLGSSRENTSFGEIAPQEDISMAANKENSPSGSIVLEGSIADRLRDLEAIVARIQEQRRVSEEKFKARMKQHEIESDDRAAEDREWTVVLQQYLLYRVHTVTLCGWYYSIAVHTTLPMPCLHYATFIHD